MSKSGFLLRKVDYCKLDECRMTSIDIWILMGVVETVYEE